MPATQAMMRVRGGGCGTSKVQVKVGLQGSKPEGGEQAALERLKAAILSVDIGTKVAKNDEASNREDGAVVFAFQFIRTCAPCVMSSVVR